MRVTRVPHRWPRVASRGFTLVEVLLALAVLCIAVLGLATLTLGGLQGSRVAEQHTLATVLLADMAERLRANRGGAVTYAIAAGTVLSPPTANCTSPGECTPGMLAALDLYRWQSAVRETLPDALTSIEVTTGPDGAAACTITLQWRQSGDAELARALVTVMV